MSAVDSEAFYAALLARHPAAEAAFSALLRRQDPGAGEMLSRLSNDRPAYAVAYMVQCFLESEGIPCKGKRVGNETGQVVVTLEFSKPKHRDRARALFEHGLRDDMFVDFRAHSEPGRPTLLTFRYNHEADQGAGAS